MANVEPIMNEVLEMLDANTKREYCLALDQVPHLVAQETPRDRYLLVEQNDPWKAARRLALYWKYRRELNGQDRWLRPMIATGHGVLGDREVALLRTGIYHYSNLPPYGPVLVVDGSQNKGATREVCDRVLFYMSTILDDPAIQTQGLAVVFAVTSSDTESNISERFALYATTGLPVRVRSFHVVQNYEPGKENLLEFLAVRRKLQTNLHFRGNCQVIASHESRSRLLVSAEQAGIPWKVLPKTCGGRFGQDELCDWIRQRMTLEDCLPINSTIPVVSSCSFRGNANHGNNQLVVAGQRYRPPKRKATTNTDGNKTANTATPQPFRKPERSWQCTYNKLGQQCTQLRQTNKELQYDNRKLEELLLQARRVVLQEQMAAICSPLTITTAQRPKFKSTSNQQQPAPAVETGPVRPPPRIYDDDFFGVPVADPFDQMSGCGGDLAHLIQFRRR